MGWENNGFNEVKRFNWAARKLHKRLLQLGANETFPYGEGDQRHDEGFVSSPFLYIVQLLRYTRLEGTFIPWVLRFRKHLLDEYPLSPGKEPISDNEKLPPKWLLESVQDQTPAAAAITAATTAETSVSETKEPAEDQYPGLHRLDHDVRPLPDTLTATLAQNKRITAPKHWQDVRLISLTVPESLSYAPGDMIAVTPKNFASDVDVLIETMGWQEQADTVVTLIPGESLYALDELPSPPIRGLENYPRLTLRAFITDYLDLRAIPRRSFFSTIAHYSDDETHQERLLEFIVPEYLDEFWDYTTRPRRSILEVLQEFHSVKIPWQHAVDVFPIFRCRQFSIASGGPLKRLSDGRTQFQLLIAIVRYQTVIKRIREGICTRYLRVLRPGSTLRVQLQRGGLHSSVSQIVGPTVLVGPGTGIAPLRSLIWKKAGLVQAFQEKHPGVVPPIGPTILVYGGRNRAADFFFAEEWAELKDEIQLHVLTAFSRDQRHKVYVQDIIREDFRLYYELLHNRNGSVYVCGSSGRMPQAIREALIESFEHGPGTGEFNRQAAEEYLLGIERIGRYKQETW